MKEKAQIGVNVNQQEGYQLIHLILVGVVCLILGALIK
jgi:hypothetical protein